MYNGDASSGARLVDELHALDMRVPPSAQTKHTTKKFVLSVCAHRMNNGHRIAVAFAVLWLGAELTARSVSASGIWKRWLFPPTDSSHVQYRGIRRGSRASNLSSGVVRHVRSGPRASPMSRTSFVSACQDRELRCAVWAAAGRCAAASSMARTCPESCKVHACSYEPNIARAYVINAEDASARWAHVQSSFGALFTEQGLPPLERIAALTTSNSQCLLPYARDDCCTQSHMRVWARLAADSTVPPTDWAIVIEDDAVLHPAVPRANFGVALRASLASAVRTLGRAPALVYLGLCNPQCRSPLPSWSVPSTGGAPLKLSACSGRCTHAYALTRELAGALHVALRRQRADLTIDAALGARAPPRSIDCCARSGVVCVRAVACRLRRTYGWLAACATLAPAPPLPRPLCPQR